ncbi:MAG: hypothetical protein NVSMB27_15520 [Ktedonobacteraceae bacterium]
MVRLEAISKLQCGCGGKMLWMEVRFHRIQQSTTVKKPSQPSTIRARHRTIRDAASAWSVFLQADVLGELDQLDEG